MTKSVILVTGASSGFGLMTARALAQTGHTVYASMRDTLGRNAPQVAAAAQWAIEQQLDLRTVELDVQSDASSDAAIARILADAGRLDVIVHNAGHTMFGPAEAFTPEQYAQQYNVNVLGTQRVNRAALPAMRKQGKGLLVWVGSSSTRGGTPPLFRSQGGDGRAGGVLLHRACAVGDRDNDHGARRLHQGHQPLRP